MTVAGPAGTAYAEMPVGQACSVRVDVAARLVGALQLGGRQNRTALSRRVNEWR